VSTDREVVRKALPSVVLGKMKMTFRMVFCSYKRIGREYFVHLTMNIFEDVVECVRHSASLLFELSFIGNYEKQISFGLLGSQTFAECKYFFFREPGKYKVYCLNDEETEKSVLRFFVKQIFRRLESSFVWFFS